MGVEGSRIFSPPVGIAAPHRFADRSTPMKRGGGGGGGRGGDGDGVGAREGEEGKGKGKGKGKGEEDGEKEKEHGEEEEEEEEALRGVVEGRKASSREGRGGQGPGAEVLLVASGGRNGERWGRDGDGAGREEENVMELVFDPMLNCYYDASTGQYFSIQ